MVRLARRGPTSNSARSSTTSPARWTASRRWRLSIYQLPGSNALDTAKGVYAKMKELKSRFPDGLDYKIVYDTTPFIRESVDEVFYTLRDAVILVAIVVLAVPAGLAGDDPADDRRAGLADRHLRRHGRCWASR